MARSSPDAAPVRPDGGKRRKVVFVSYGTFGSNSAGHIFGFANGLAGLGYAVAVCAAGSPLLAYSYGRPDFAFFANDALAADPKAVIGFDGSFRPQETIIVCWTPREAVRRIVQPIAEQLRIPYVVHLEDNEEHLTKVWRGAGRLPGLRKKPIPDSRADPERLAPFLEGAAGATIIEPRLKETLPPALPFLVLTPGVDLNGLGEPLPTARAEALRRVVGVPADAPLIVYTGNVHRANAEEMRSLYDAVHRLHARRGVMLVRTGTDYVDPELFGRSAPETGIVALGQVERPLLVDLIKCADLFVQPGAPGPFNDYRLPSKLPEAMAVGRPVVLPASNVGKALRHGVDAMLLEAGTADEIVAHVEAILDDPDLAGQLGARARAYAETHFRWETEVRKLDAFLRQVA